MFHSCLTTESMTGMIALPHLWAQSLHVAATVTLHPAICFREYHVLFTTDMDYTSMIANIRNVIVYFLKSEALNSKIWLA